MTTIDRSALLTFSAQQMYELVNDVESYPKFMHGCIDARIVSRSDGQIIGELTLGKAGLKYTIVTRNTLSPFSEMTMELVKGPFKEFSATWNFIALTEDACKVTLKMEFSFAGGIVDFALEKMFNKSANTLVDALVERAHTVYGVEAAR